MRVLVTRPANAAQETARKLETLGHEPIIAPLLETRFPGYPISGLARAQALIFTSTNGVSGFVRVSNLRDLPVFAVGARTAEASREAGFSVVTSAEGDAADLAALIRERLAPANGPLIFARGRHVAGILGESLGKAGFVLHSAVVYEALIVDALPGNLRTSLQEDSLDVVLFFSPRTAKAFVRLLEKEGLADHSASLEALCLSKKVADRLSPLRWKAVRVADTPNQTALLKLL